jgi:hypothetical protein
MKTILASLLLAASGLLTVQSATAGSIGDNYIGAGGNGADVIGASVYNIAGATITRADSVLTITIATNFAGHAGVDSTVTPGGIGYGDLFLSQVWNPAGAADKGYLTDNATTGTKWSYGFALDDNYSNKGGKFKLMQLNGKTNADNIINSENVISCTNCDYREGQATFVNKETATDTGLLGSWTVTADKSIQFTIKVGSSDLLNFSSFAMHWGETCQNDVIEGVVRMVPIPGTLPLLGLGLIAMAGIARRKQAAQI